MEPLDFLKSIQGKKILYIGNDRDIVDSNVDLFHICKVEHFNGRYVKDHQINKKYDLIFIDGLHTYDAVLSDYNKSVKSLKKGGMIVIHDCWPNTARQASEKYVDGGWCGSVWKFANQLLHTNPDCSILEDGTGYLLIKNAVEVETDELYKSLSYDPCYTDSFESYKEGFMIEGGEK